ncbi:MAG: choice-of-anchor D domain-containing protein [Calditrichaeota bacterium]|nr:MAG: choice-of-anchor D domain-containing protein [Calditrichota bacterium]
MKTKILFFNILALVFLLNKSLYAEDKPRVVEHVFLVDGQLVEKAGIGDVTVELKFDIAMNTDVEPEIHYSLSTADFPLTLPARGAWESDTLWQGNFTISSNLPSSGDGLYYFRINGALSSADVAMDTLISATTLEICRPDVAFNKSHINLGFFLAGNTVQVPLEISNPGCDDLTIQSISVGSPFFITNIGQNQVIPRESSRTINVGINTTERARWDDSLTIIIPQLRPTTYHIPISAISHGARLLIEPGSLNFGNVELGADSTQSVVIHNTPAADSALSDTLYIFSESISDPAIFSVSSYNRAIAPGDSSRLFVTFQPTKALQYIGHFVTLQNSDATQSNARIILLGRGIDNDPPPQIPGLVINWNTTFAGYTSQDSIRICWQPVTESSGIAEIRWKFTNEPKAPNTNNDLGLGGAIDLDESTTCIYLPLRSRLTNGLWYCYLWFVDGAGNSGYTTPIATVLNYDTRVPGVPVLLERTIAEQQWFSRFHPFNLRFLLPKKSSTGRNDIYAVRWNYGARPESASDYNVQRALGAHDDTVTVSIPFNSIECGEDSLFVWLVDSTGNSSASNITAIPYSFDGCPPEITRIRSSQLLVGTIGQAFMDTVLIQDETAISQAEVYYRFGGAESQEPPAQAVRIAETDSFVVTIPQGAVTRRGLEYRLKAADQFGQVAYGPESEGTCSTGSGENIWFPIQSRIVDQSDHPIDSQGNPLPLKSGNEMTHYQMISVPYELENPAVAAVLEDDLGGYDDSQWRFFDYIAETEGDPWVEGLEARDFQPGRSFFIITKKSGVVFDGGMGTTVRTICPDTLTLNEGWNFIATPFAFPVHKSSLRLINSNSNLTLRSYVAGWDITDVLEPWNGYALYVTRENDEEPIYLIIEPKAIVSHAQKTKPEAVSLAAGEWTLQISAQAGDFTDEHNWAGQYRRAENQIDEFDMAEPPAIGRHVAVSFPHQDWRQPATHFSADIRPVAASDQIWEFAVASTVPGEDVHVKFNLAGDVTQLQSIYLVDEKLGVKFNLLQKQEYTLIASELSTERTLKLISGSPAFVEENTVQVAEMPVEFQLAQNYPNPFNPETRIKFSLPQKDYVQIAVYDQLGRLVRLLANEEKAAGYHEIIWNGLNNAGQLLPSGPYFLQMRSDAFSQTRKMMLLK